jgi:hypothetical protein
MKKLVLLCALLMLFSCLAESESRQLIEQFYGVWEGTGKQDNNSVWTIKVAIKPNKYRIDYPSLNCGGVLEFVKEIDKSVMFKETLTYGVDKCINHGTTFLTIETKGKALFDWFYPNGSPGAEGTLMRQTDKKN